MKTINIFWFKRLIALAIFPVVAATGFTQGQIIFGPSVLPSVRIEAADAGASEYGPSTGLFWIWREGGDTNLPLTVTLRFDGSAMPQADYRLDPSTNAGLPEGQSASITIPARAVRAGLTIIPVDDRIAEGPETVVATIQLPLLILVPGQTVSLLPGYVVGRSSTATVTISDDDTGFVSLPTVSIAVDDSRASETERNPGTFRVTRIGDRDHELRVNYTVGGRLITGPNDANADPAGPFGVINEATNGEDFDRLPGFIVIPAGAASATIVVRPINDQIPEGDEAVVIKLIAASTYSINAPEQASIIIEDNDDPLIDLPPSIEVFASDPDAKEPLTLIDALPGGIAIVPSRETATFTFVRTGRTDIQLRIEYQLSGTASNGVDYTRLSGVLEMPSGARTATVTITPLPDTFREGTETIVLTVLAPICPAIFPAPPWCYSVGKTNSARASIADSEITIPSAATVTVIASDREAAERRLPDNRVDSGRFTVRRTGSVALPLLVFYEVGGTSSNGVDYVRLPGTVTIPSSREAVEIEVSPIDDRLSELPETVILTLVPSRTLSPLPSYNVGEPNDATATIIDDDQPDNQRPTVTVSAPDAEAVESRSGTSSNTGTFRFSRTGDLSKSIEVFYQMSGIARNGTDYVELDGDATIAAGSAVRDIFVQPRSDNQVEEAETVVLTLRSNESYTVGQPAVATVRILDSLTPSNRPPSIVINSPADGTSFAGPATIEIKATAIDPQSYISRVEFFDGDRRIGVSEIVFIRAPDPGTPIEHTFLWSDVTAGQHTLTVQARVGNGNLVVSSPVRVSVVEKPNLPTVTVASPDTEAVESRSGTSTNTATFRLTRTGDLSRSLEVFYQMSGVARNGTDNVELDGDATIAAGSAVRDILVQPRADNQVEEAETVVLTLRSNANYTVGQPAVATVRILDNSTPSNRPPSIVISSPADGTSFAAPATIEIKATAIDPQGYISRVEFYAGGRRIGVSEIVFIRAPDPGTPIEHTIVWSNVTAGQYSLTARARARDETVTSTPVRVSVADVQSLPVVNIDAVKLVGFEDGTNNSATLRVTRNGSVSEPLEVRYTVGGTASNGSDYRELAGRIAIPAGTNSAVITVAPLSDKAFEFIESVVVTVQAPECLATSPPPAGCYRVGASARATVYIIDGGLPPFPNAARSGLPVLASLVEVEHHTDGRCRVRAVGQPGLNVAIESSTDLMTWAGLANVSLVDGVADFTDANAAAAPRRFYRVRPTSIEK